MNHEGFRLSENVEKSDLPNVPDYMELAGGLTLLVWTLASAFVVGGCCANSNYDALFFAAIAAMIIVILAPFGAILFAAGIIKILKDTRS
jgi:hypothetical protein